MKVKVKPGYFVLICILTLNSFNAFAQDTKISGIVSDAHTGEPLPYVSIYIDKVSAGTLTDIDGKYTLTFDTDLDSLIMRVSYLGYQTKKMNIITHNNQIINVKLEPEVQKLKDIVVKEEKGKYRNKDNPAVALIKKVIEHKSENRKEAYEYYEYEKYEKIQFAINNITEDFKNKKAFKKFQFVFENIDSSTLGGNPVLPMFLRETISEVYYRQSPKSGKEIIKADKTIAFEEYINNDGLNMYLNNMYQDVNIYENNIMLLTNQFISPISNFSPAFYLFFIADTISENSEQFIKLGFVPRNHSDFLFQGYIYITMDGNYAVTKLDMSVKNDINLNWVQKLKIVQRFEKIENMGYILVYDEFSADFGINEKQTGVFGQRIVSFKDFKINQPRIAEDYEGIPLIIDENARMHSDSFWSVGRHMELSNSEKNVYTIVDSIKNVPLFKHSMELIILSVSGFKNIGPDFDLGPFASFYSFNPIEGLRLKVGGRTTPNFSNRFLFEGYGAYGFRDKQWKYLLGTTISLSTLKVNEFPAKSLKLNYMRDVKIPGQDLKFIQEDNFLLSFRRGINDKWIYLNLFKIEYLHEFKNNFSYSIGYNNRNQEALGGIHFNSVHYNELENDIKGIQTSELNISLRWAPGEKFYQGKIYRTNIPTNKPITTFRYVKAFKDFTGGQYDYQSTSINIYKRCYLSQIGYTDVSLEGGKIFGTVPFPLLSIHQANQSYAFLSQSYNLMNFLEFVSDQYASVNIDHYFNGFFLNKIALIKKLKWREALSLKVLYGSISKNNDPDSNPELFKFPVNSEGIPITYSLNRKPYIEGSVAIGNILKFIRVDLVKRFTYNDHPGISSLGVRARIKFDF
jgi:hypothetical protein